MTRLEQLERMVEVLREALTEIASKDDSRCDESSGVASRSLAAADRIAAESVEATNWEVVMGWLMTGSSRFIQIDNDRKVFHFFADDSEGNCDSVQAFNGEPLPHCCIAQMAAWVRAQGGGK